VKHTYTSLNIRLVSNHCNQVAGFVQKGLGTYVLSCLNDGIQGSLGSVGKGFKLKDTSGSVPENRLGLQDGLSVDLVGLGAAVESHPTIRDTFRIINDLGGGVGCELVTSDIVDGEVELNILGLGLGNQILNDLSTVLVEERAADL